MSISGCVRHPCGMTTGGCFDQDCPNKSHSSFQPVQPFGVPVQPSWAPNQPQTYWTPRPEMGCICPPTSEKTCESPMCPRKNHLKSGGA